MPEHAPTPDSTVRMDTGRPSGRPPVTGQSRALPAPAGALPASAPPAGAPPQADDTRPVGRDWMRTQDHSQPEIHHEPAPVRSDAEGTVATTSTRPSAATEPSEATGGTETTAVLTADRADEAAWAQETWDGTGWDADATDTEWRTEGLTTATADAAAPPNGERAEDDEADTRRDEPRRPGGPRGPRDRGLDGPWWRRRAVLVPAAAVAVLGGAYGVDLLASSDDVPRHTVVGGVDIGGFSPAAASSALEKSLAPRLAADRTVVAADVRSSFSPKAAGLGLDVPATVAVAGHQPLNPWIRLTTLFSDRDVRPVLGSDATDLTAELAALAAKVDRAPVEATVALDGTTPSVVQPADGRRLDRRAAGAALTAALVRDSRGPVRLPVVVSHPHVTAAEAQKVLDGTVTPALSAPVTVVSQDGSAKADLQVSAIAAALTFTPKDDGELAVGIDPAKLRAGLGNGFATFGSAATDASFRVSGTSISVVPSVDGSGVDPAKLATQLLAVLTAPAPRTVTAELGPVPARFTTEQADALGVKEQIGSFTTNFAATPSATNIRVVAAKVNGAVVKPGETFSLNTFTGPRGTAQGYVPAGVIEGGKFTTAVGGGISQFATTMFNAEFFSGVQDVHHQPHSYWISRYPAGREATVFDGLIDLAWKNDADTGIYIQTAWTPSSITVTFWGTKHYDVESVSGARRNVVQPAVQETPDDGTCKPQAGMEGFDITVTRVFHPVGGTQALKKQDFHTHYKAEPVIHCVATSAPAGTSPAPAPSGTGRRPGPAEANLRRTSTRRRRC